MSAKRIAIIATDYFEEVELTSPSQALIDAGHHVDIVAPNAGEIKGLNHVEPGQNISVDKTLAEANPEDYDAVVLPGGVVNADHLRIDEQAQAFVKNMMQAHKPVAVICHGPWLLVSADVVEGRHLTSYQTVRDDIENAGGEWSDEEVVIDNNLITSRKPDDLPAFNKAIVDALEG